MRYSLALGVLLLILVGSGSTETKTSHKVAKALEKVIKSKKCNGSSLKAVFTLSKSRRYHDYVAITNYAESCITPSYVAEKIRSNAELGWFREEPESFMDESFMAKYKADNPNEPPIHFGWREGANCCRPEHAYGAILESIQWREDKGAIKDRESVEKYLKRNLFRPCFFYYEQSKKLMFQISRASNYIRGGLQVLVDPMPKEVKHDIFRFIMCYHLQEGLTQMAIADYVADGLKLLD